MGITDAERSQKWRQENPERAAKLQEATIANRRKRKEEDPEFAEDVRRKAREAMEERRRRAADGTASWKVVVRLSGEKRARGIVDVKYTSAGKIRGLVRQKPGNNVPKPYPTKEEAQKVAESLLEAFPDKVEVAKVSVI